MNNKIKTIHIIALIVIIIIIGGAFYCGMLYGKNQTQKSGFPGGNFQTRINKTGANGSSFISGNIISKDNNSITLQLPNNSSKIILYSDVTQINKSAIGTANDLSVGASISVTGTTNSEGSVTAQSIQIRPTENQNPK